MRKYEHLIFDIDDTLLDFHSAFTSAQEKVAAFLAIECSDEYKRSDEECGWKAWKESGLENTDDKDVQITEQCLMIGDSIINDIVGAKQSGMDACFYNPGHKNVSGNIIFDVEIYSLAELKEILQK